MIRSATMALGAAVILSSAPALADPPNGHNNGRRGPEVTGAAEATSGAELLIGGGSLIATQHFGAASAESSSSALTLGNAFGAATATPNSATAFTSTSRFGFTEGEASVSTFGGFAGAAEFHGVQAGDAAIAGGYFGDLADIDQD